MQERGLGPLDQELEDVPLLPEVGPEGVEVPPRILLRTSQLGQGLPAKWRR